MRRVRIVLAPARRETPGVADRYGRCGYYSRPKVKFSEAGARNSARQMGGGNVAFPCRHCGRWHVGHPSGRG